MKVRLQEGLSARVVKDGGHGYVPVGVDVPGVAHHSFRIG